MDIQTAKDEVIRTGRALVQTGLVARTWGNVSCRIDGRRFAVTPSGIGYERLTQDEIVVVDNETLAYEGEIRPSSESGIHAAVYRVDPDVNFVIHTHQVYATCLSVAGFKTLAPTPAQQERLRTKIGLAGYGLPGSKKLRKAVMAAYAPDTRAVIMQRHGALLAGKDRKEAFERAAFLEDVCRDAMREIAEAHERALLTPALRVERGAGKASPRALGIIASEQEDFAVFSSLYETAFALHPGLRAVSLLITPALRAQSAGRRRIPAILDDFAQIVGADANVTASHSPQKIISKREGRDAVFLAGKGVLCFAEDPYDLVAIQILCEKNALAWQHARRFGWVKALSRRDRKILRHWYVTRYAKKR